MRKSDVMPGESRNREPGAPAATLRRRIAFSRFRDGQASAKRIALAPVLDEKIRECPCLSAKLGGTAET